MGEFVAGIRARAIAWGAPGLFLVAFLDSSFLPLPGITDLLLIVMVTHRPHLAPMLMYVAITTVGSLCGCLVMHFLGRKGGEAFVQKRFASRRIEHAMKSLQRYGVVAVLIPSLLPPPAPFKIFLLLAGASGISAARFTVAILIGRLARYLAVGGLALRYGPSAQAYLRAHGTTVSLAAVIVLAAGFTVYLWWRRAQARKNR